MESRRWKIATAPFLAAMGKGAEQAAGAHRDACRPLRRTLQDFRESGRLGCPDRYRSFEVPLRDLLRRLHGSTHHSG